MAVGVLKEYLEEYAGNIMIFVGALLLFVGLLFLANFDSLLSVVTSFFGVILVAYGFFARLGLFYTKLGSSNGLGTILICISVVFFAVSVSLTEYQVVNGIKYVPQYIRGTFEGYRLDIISSRPYVWFSWDSLWIGLSMFLAGLILKVHRAPREQR
jgi:hypothetical protein